MICGLANEICWTVLAQVVLRNWPILCRSLQEDLPTAKEAQLQEPETNVGAAFQLFINQLQEPSTVNVHHMC